jgi:hypothetical protein
VSTARELIYDAMTAAGILGQGDVAPSNADAQIALRRLQRMLDSWSVDNLMVYSTTQETITLSAGDPSYTTSNLSTSSRPVDLEPAFIRLSGTDYPLHRVTRQEYADIAYKASEGMPTVVWYEPTMTAGAFLFYPTPSETMTAYFNVRRVLASSLTLDTSFSLPPGYETAIVDNLTVELCGGGFGAQVTQEMRDAAFRSKAILKRQNFVVPMLWTPFDGCQQSDIYAG